MSDVTFQSVKVGNTLPEHVCGPITRTTLALYAGASGDHNPMHIDIDFARKGGMDDVFAHGMLSMAYLAQLLTNWVEQSRVVSWKARFVSITPVNATVRCNGEIIEKIEHERQVRIALTARVENGPETLLGEALVALA